ncbi:C40 family peptidase [Streptomyces sp. 891-h]|uniref:C40 family peptidase n=1 Tax=Streptomyces sp. 891-h TaxID=2720714 RepID=UPI001FA96163|nr:C40 family peptidase [Streptomyces sp. 891-h]
MSGRGRAGCRRRPDGVPGPGIGAVSAGLVLAAVAVLVPAAPGLGSAHAAGARAPGTPGPGPAPGPPDVGRKSVSELLGQLGMLYQRTEEASEAYNRTAEKLKTQRAATRRAQAQLSRARSTLAAERRRAGELARQQYRGEGTGLPPTVQMLLARDPHRLLERRHLLKRAAGDQAATVRRLSDGTRRHAAAAKRAREALARQERLAKRKKEQRNEVRKRLRKVERLLSSLTGNQRARLDELEQDRADAAQQKLVASGALDPSGARGSASAQGRKALHWALKQVGKPYVWGAEGPRAFDCSGLTWRAWRHANRDIPRTSQEQWRRLPKVPLDELRPGDLVIYFKGATHVGMYAGGGRVVHAPRPGSVVRLTPLAASPPIGAVRPDGRRA